MLENMSTSRSVPIFFLVTLVCVSIAAPFFIQVQEWTGELLVFRERAVQYQWVSWAWFSLAVFVSQLLIIPSGSFLMLLGGFLLGAPAATLLFSVIQLASTILLVGLGKKSGVDAVPKLVARWSSVLENTITTLNRVPFTLSIVLRLFPVLPSAVACLLSVVFSIPLRTFLMATALVGWIRPLLFASAGALLPSLMDIKAARSDIVISVLWPVLLIFLAGFALLLFRIWLTRQTQGKISID